MTSLLKLHHSDDNAVLETVRRRMVEHNNYRMSHRETNDVINTGDTRFSSSLTAVFYAFLFSISEYA